MTKIRRLGKTGKTADASKVGGVGEMCGAGKARGSRGLRGLGKSRGAGRAAGVALLTAALLGVITSDAASQTTGASGRRALEVVAKDAGKCGALLVGVDEYETLTPLEYASSDMRKLRDALVEIGFPSDSIRMFVSDGRIRERPSREKILKALDEMLAASGPDSTVFIALSGHGFETEDGDAAFCPEDVEAWKDGERNVVSAETAILIEDVARRLKKDDAKFKLLIVDACREPASTERSATGKARSFSPIAEPNGVAFLQSCDTQQLSWEHPELGGGVFSAFFAEGLRGAADSDGDGGVSFLEVCNYAMSRTQSFVREKRDASQTPFYRFTGVRDFWLKPPTKKTDDAEAKLAKANALFMEAFTAYEAGDYATAYGKCKASLSEAQTTAAQKLLAKIDAAQSQTGGATATQATTAQSQSSTPPTGPSSSGQGQNSERPSVEVAWDVATKAGARQTLTVDGVEYAFRYCPAGTFTMGSPASESSRDAVETLHDVKLTNGFWMLETEVTQALWKSVMGSNPSWFCSTGGGSSKVSGVDTSNFPVDRVSWNDCQEFIAKLNALGVAPDGLQFRLPTEAEWEYACRAGTSTAYFWGDSLNGDNANCDGNYPCGTSTKGQYLKRTTQVGSYAPNAWGLYDMHGNVLEWCEDLKIDYENIKSAQDPINVTQDSDRVLRGGSWYHGARYCRSAYRSSNVPTGWNFDYGFRLVLGRSSSSSK
ncbi:MAG: SUMF1/EgtB/PvdO family nonheme iron enzyme [Thermoguttaceae bacterium]|nr:SUMF1/EgtB/PvdO family nonheme iron enzyme [Thermoguttaceae bacterium]